MGTVLKTLRAAFRTVLELACREGLTKRWWLGCLSMAKLSSICFPSAFVTLSVSHGFGCALWHYLNKKEANTWSTVDMQSKMAFDQGGTHPGVGKM